MKMRLLPHPILTPVLAIVWILLSNGFTIGHLLLGLLLGWIIPIFTLRFWPDRIHIKRPLALLRFVGMLFHDILTANVAVAYYILRGSRRVTPGFVVVPLELESDFGISLLANTISLTPGTVSAWLDPERRHLVVHGLNVRNPEALVESIKQRYEAPLLEIFESC